MDKIKIGIVVTSDRAFNGIYEDISGKAIQDVLKEYILNECEYIYRLIEDEQDIIEKNFIDLCDIQNCDLVVSTGGTGPASRDVTPEATQNVCEKMMPGFGELMRQTSLKYVPTAILSRQTAGIRKQSLIINLPGKPKSIKECLEAVFPAIPYCIDLIGGRYINANEDNIKIFRPKS
ncbi:molybdopterin adenylyltransferase [Helicobacter sp. 13S00482-2]|uniref:molybdopterin adenylyltransferase n=1 Tax=Helicobacter sp. 13S00482-2 TaxID=1476200 RepID=UPI000BA6A4AF|nr:molybdopterin adenylyltransferase [Helicobacter sp. 13S00482-2]PAF53512.1 molybdopterin adenylyltransferase [Helicobacter sp. 13S00482-2]